MNSATETNTIEYKREYSDTIIKDVVSFLNYSLGGHIYVGIENNGAVCGVENSDDLQLKIINVLRDSIYPSILGLFDVLVERIGISNIAVEKNLSKLKAENKLKRIGGDKGGYWEIVG